MIAWKRWPRQCRVQSTTQFDRGGSINVLFGQSYQLFGLNSFAVHDVTNTGIDSGLQNTRSDYVAPRQIIRPTDLHIQCGARAWTSRR